jgi:hypothetical protein
MKATLILRSREVYDDILVEMIAWRLPEPVPGCLHPFKYRFYAGILNGGSLIRYDNERRKGDHRHIGGKEAPYTFTTLYDLKNDFMRDVKRWIEENRP